MKSATSSDKKQTLWDKIDKMVQRDGCTYVEAIARYADDNNLTHNKMAKMLCPRLRLEVENEVRNSRMVRGEVLSQFNKTKRKKK